MDNSTPNLLNHRKCLFSVFKVILLAWLVQCCNAADVYWTNTAGGNWSVSANWSTGTVPGSSDNVFIISNGTYTVLLDDIVNIHDLTLGGSIGTQTLSNDSSYLNIFDAGVINANGVLISGG